MYEVGISNMDDVSGGPQYIGGDGSNEGNLSIVDVNFDDIPGPGQQHTR